MQNTTFYHSSHARISAEPVTDKALWDRFVDESPNAQLFHKWDFLRIQEKYTGYRLYPCGIYHGDELISIIPLFHKKKKGFNFVYSPPQAKLSYIPYMSFALSPAYYRLPPREKIGAMCQIVSEADRFARRFSPGYTSFAVGPGEVDTRPYVWNGFETELMYTYTFDLSKPVEELWGSLDKHCRTNIVGARKENLAITESRDAKKFFDLMRSRLDDEGSTFFHRQTHRYLEEMIATFPDYVKLYFLYRGDELIGADVNYEYNGWCTSWMGTAAGRAGFNANEYLLWELITRAKAAGFRTYENLGADELRLNLFKSKFNPDLVPYFYFTKKNRLFKLATYGSEKVSKILGSHNVAGMAHENVNQIKESKL